MENKVLSKTELDKIQDEIEKIAQEVEWLDPTISGEDVRLANHLSRLEELEKILLTSLKSRRIKKSGLTVVK